MSAEETGMHRNNRADRMMLITNVYPVGGHMAGWRHPSA
jgi:hypothetical protein